MNTIKAAIYRERVEWRALLIGFSIVLALILAGLIISTIFVNNPDSSLVNKIGAEITINGESHPGFGNMGPKEILTQLLQGDDKNRRLFLVIPMFTSTQSLFLIGLIMLVAHLLTRGFSRDRKSGTDAFFRALPVPPWQSILTKLLFNVVAMSAAVFAAEFIYWMLHSLLVALTFNGGGDFSFMQILGSHWQGRLIGSMILLQLVQLPWLLVLFAYLIATTILFPRFEGVAGILVPVLLAILETIALGTHRIFSLLGSFVSIPGRQVAKLGEAFASGGTADWLAPFQNGEFATAALISLMLFVASIFWFRWREVT